MEEVKLVRDSFSERRITYGELLKKLENLDPVLQDLGISAGKNDRIHTYIKHVGEMNARLGTPDLNKYLAENNKQGECFFSVVELQELANIIEHLDFKSQKKNVLKEKFKEILNGTVLPKDEQPANSKARNTMFELSLASDFQHCGYGAILCGPNPDFLVEVNARRYFFQCKRTFGEKAIPRLLNEAYGQLERDLKNPAVGDRGIIALSVTRVFTQGYKALVVDSVEEARDELWKNLQDVLKNYGNHWHNLPNKRVVAVIIHMCTPVILRSNPGTPFGARFMIIDNIDTIDKNRYKVFLRDFEDLKASHS